MKANIKAVVMFGRSDEYPDGIRIAVGIGTAVTDANEIEFRTLHADCETPIHERKHCEHCGEEAHEVLSGYEVAKGQFVTFTPDEIKEAKPPRNPMIELRKFVPREQITPLMVKSHRYLIPGQISADGYGILYQGLIETGSAGVGSHALYGKEYPCAVYPYNGVLVLASMFLAEQIVEPDFSAPIPASDFKELAVDVVRLNMGELSSSDLSSKSKEFMLDLIRAKQAGRELPKVEKVEARETTDLMASLRASIAASERAQKKPRTRAKK